MSTGNDLKIANVSVFFLKMLLYEIQCVFLARNHR